jgi:predicted MPP superfamily phosphohydrolase
MSIWRRAARFRLALALLAAAGLILLVVAYWTALTDPVVRRAELLLLPPNAAEAELRLVLISDIHVAGPDMPPERLVRIVGRINALRPDAVLIAGDLVSDKTVATRTYSLDEAVAPLRGLRARLGVFAVLGNHDHWRDGDAARRALRRAGIAVLGNRAVQAGPLAIGGIDDAYTRHHDLPAAVAAMRKLGGVPVLISHSPDPLAQLPPDVPLMVAGHTHCGQIRLPLAGALVTMSEHGDRYACGVVRERGRTLVVSAGLGTSILPFRLGAVPDVWEITLKRR